MSEKKLWGGRFEGNTNALMEAYSESVRFDWRLYKQDIAGSLAHARMLTSVGVLSTADLADIERGMIQIRKEIDQGEFNWSTKNEDVHMNIEARLTELVGDAGKRLHTGRSRNDQVATDLRLYMRESIKMLQHVVSELQLALVDQADKHYDTIMPGYTHLQSAQPVTFGHHLLAWNAMLERDYERLGDCLSRMDYCPLGAAALAGTSYPIDREQTAQALGFKGPITNSLDAVSDRDFVIEFNAAAAILMMHLSRMSEEMINWSSEGYRFVDLGDAFCTGSSIMPQKKNPDVAELTRGKSARVIGNLTALLTLMKGQPLSYNRDNQEDKEPVFDTIDTLEMCLRVFAAMIPGISVDKQRMYDAAGAGYATATDLADYLVRKEVPFRDSHAIVGNVVKMAIAEKIALENIPLAKLQELSPLIENDVYAVLNLEGSVNSRDHVGGTAPIRVQESVKSARNRIENRT